ncbi:MarR family winged helix-turn-helix transcriptional regulator [Oceanobacillus indicireducens]|uniref:MarR family transcriptional regulator n=1 Tax=Oceanobacillus indicireducens TaxID=1004261 RepID=A0A918D568_9BACI|nr:MarR family transcriptional regulator [Oceanobacillus indicireducens]GGN65516.1 MarR family transcriptional regulator [Oceanobacillus indicireducens]
MIDELNKYFSDIYFELHPLHEEAISHQSVRILQMVHKKQFVMIRDIAEHLSISHNTASEHVKKLVNSGWIKKERYEEDQRKVYLHLTELGLKIVKKNTELDEEKLQAALDKLSEEEKLQVVQAFQLLSEVSK